MNRDSKDLIVLPAGKKGLGLSHAFGIDDDRTSTLLQAIGEALGQTLAEMAQLQLDLMYESGDDEISMGDCLLIGGYLKKAYDHCETVGEQLFVTWQASMMMNEFIKKKQKFDKEHIAESDEFGDLDLSNPDSIRSAREKLRAKIDSGELSPPQVATAEKVLSILARREEKARSTSK